MLNDAIHNTTDHQLYFAGSAATATTLSQVDLLLINGFYCATV